MVFFYMHHPTDRIAYTTDFATPVVALWLEQEIAQSVHHRGLDKQLKTYFWQTPV